MIKDKLKDIEGLSIYEDFSMAKVTSFKTGGTTEILAVPHSVESLRLLMQTLLRYDENYYFMGNGSNLLIRDGGYSGVIVKLGDEFSEIDVEGEKVMAGSAALLSTTAKIAQKAVLTGMEFASGIPGSVGGAMTMNAGAYGGEMKDIVDQVLVMDLENSCQLLTLNNEDMDFSYRHSVIQDKSYIVLSTTFKLEPGYQKEIKDKMLDFTNRRNSKQPVDLPSAGSTFKRPMGYYAGKLIEDAGLKGVRYKGAQVSDKHSGFIVNKNHATTSDIEQLIKIVQKNVHDKFNVKLEPEVKIIGEDIEINS